MDIDKERLKKNLSDAFANYIEDVGAEWAKSIHKGAKLILEKDKQTILNLIDRQPAGKEMKDAWNLLSVQMLCSYCAEGGLEKCGEIRCQKMVRVLHKLFDVKESFGVQVKKIDTDEKQMLDAISEAFFLLATKKVEGKHGDECAEILSHYESLRNNINSIIEEQ